MNYGVLLLSVAILHVILVVKVLAVKCNQHQQLYYFSLVKWKKYILYELCIILTLQANVGSKYEKLKVR